MTAYHGTAYHVVYRGDHTRARRVYLIGQLVPVGAVAVIADHFAADGLWTPDGDPRDRANVRHLRAIAFHRVWTNTAGLQFARLLFPEGTEFDRALYVPWSGVAAVHEHVVHVRPSYLESDGPDDPRFWTRYGPDWDPREPSPGDPGYRSGLAATPFANRSGLAAAPFANQRPLRDS